MTEVQDFSEAELAKVRAFGFDERPDLLEHSTLVAVRASHIAELSAQLLAGISS